MLNLKLGVALSGGGIRGIAHAGALKAFEDNKINGISSVVRSLLWAVIWFLYLIYSDQVQENFPSEYRKSKPRDWYIIAAIVILPLFFTACGIIDINKSADGTETDVVGENNMVKVDCLKAKALLKLKMRHKDELEGR